MNKTLISIFLLISLFATMALDKHAQQKKTNEPIFSFGLIADIQYADMEPRGIRYYRNSLQKFNEAVDTFNKENLEFVISLGDYVDSYPEGYDSLQVIANRLNVPLHHVVGNHDFTFAENRKAQVLEIMQLDNSYYDFRKESYRFIILDGNDISTRANEEGSRKYQKAVRMLKTLKENNHPHAEDWNGAMGREQINWLHNTLQKAQSNGEQVMLFSHFPIYPPSRYNLWNDTEVLDVIDQYDHIIAYINGHYHRGDFAVRNGVYYITLEGMVETPDETAYAIVDVYDDYIKIRGFGRVADRILH